MRISMMLLTCLLLAACGKTGALFLPEEEETRQPETNAVTETENGNQAE